MNWDTLKEHYRSLEKTSLKEMFASDPNRGQKFHIEHSGLYLDFSKNPITQLSLDLLEEFANQQFIKEKIQNLYSGGIVNQSEQRAALHTSLRDPENINDIDSGIHQEIFSAQSKMLDLAQQLQDGMLTNRKGESLKHLVCIGIGGSYLGPKFVIDALTPISQSKISLHFIANLDPNALNQSLKGLDLEHCLFFIASKTFGTFETLQNAKVVKERLLLRGLTQADLKHHFIAATSNTHAAKTFGCQDSYILKLWDFVGGRYSLWSSIGFPIAVSLGKANFLELLTGAHAMDRHFVEEPLQSNMPFILGALAIWFQNIVGLNSRAIIPYDHNLKTFPAFLQQLEMESLGKRVDTSGKKLEQIGGAIIWGSEGTNSQHAFHQLLHQSELVIPCDFIVCKQSHYEQAQHELLFTQCLAQSRALMMGNPSEDRNKFLNGNKPSNTLLLDKLEPKNLGALLALYEHKVFVQACMLDINPFDQWGVEFGKKTADDIKLAKKNGKSLDSSSDTLLNYFQKP